MFVISTAAGASDLERLEQLYDSGFHDPFLSSALRKLIERQITRDQADLESINQALADFERRYGLSTAQFWEQFNAGKLEDTADWLEWNVLCKMRKRITSRLAILQSNPADG